MWLFQEQKLLHGGDGRYHKVPGTLKVPGTWGNAGVGTGVVRGDSLASEQSSVGALHESPPHERRHPRRVLSGIFVQWDRAGARARSSFLKAKKDGLSPRMGKNPLRGGTVSSDTVVFIVEVRPHPSSEVSFLMARPAQGARVEASCFHAGPWPGALHLAPLTVPPARSGLSARWARAGRCHRPLRKTSSPKAPIGDLRSVERGMKILEGLFAISVFWSHIG